MNHAARPLLPALALMILPAISVAAGSPEGELAKRIGERFPGSNPEHIAPSPVSGIYEVSLGGELIYVTPDGRFAFTGRLFDLERRADLSEPVLAGLRLKMLDAVPENEMIIFEPNGKAAHTITTFTDVDCPYCRKMHQEIDQLTAAGIRVRYLMFPRTAVGSPSFVKAISVWCADDPRDAMTRAKLGEIPAKRECPNPVIEHMQLANRLGLTGTPMTVTDSGERLDGYVAADQLIRRLNADKLEKVEN